MLWPKLRNETRWNSTFEVGKRYQELREYLPLLSSPDIDQVVFTLGEERCADVFLSRLSVLESVTKALQNYKPTVRNVRGLVDAVMDDYPETVCRLTSAANIFQYPICESALIRLQNKLLMKMSMIYFLYSEL